METHSNRGAALHSLTQMVSYLTLNCFAYFSITMIISEIRCLFLLYCRSFSSFIFFFLFLFLPIPPQILQPANMRYVIVMAQRNRIVDGLFVHNHIPQRLVFRKRWNYGIDSVLLDGVQNRSNEIHQTLMIFVFEVLNVSKVRFRVIQIL